MKTAFILGIAFLLFFSCTDKNKEEEKKMEQTIQKIDSLKQTVTKEIEELKDFTQEIEENLKEIDSI